MAAERLVLDSFAVIAYLQREPGYRRVREWLQEAADGRVSLAMSTVNLAEVLYQVERRQGASAARVLIDNLPALAVRFVDADMELSESAARVKAAFPVSLADAYATALAQSLDGAVVTGDPDFKRLEDVVAVEWLTA